MKLTQEILTEAFSNAVLMSEFAGGFDTFLFRKNFEESNFSENVKDEILNFTKTNLNTDTYTAVKKQVDKKESLFTDYFSNPSICTKPRKFRGAYSPVVYKTFAGLMVFCLE